MEREINQLIENSMQFFIEYHYVERSIENYRSLWNRGILRYMKEKKVTMYTPEIGQRFINDCFPEEDIRPVAKDMIRSIKILDDALSPEGIKQRRLVVPVKHPLHGEIGTQMQKVINYLKSMRKSIITINRYKLYLSRFSIYLNNEEVSSVNDISEWHILKFISTTLNNKIPLVSCFRVLFRYWYENHISSENYEDVLKNYKQIRREKIPSYYDANEVRLIESTADRNSGLGKRNYAILLLASRLGLRASDIANLQFSNIDWDKNEISLTQIKTGSQVKLPLLTEIGNSIIDYLKYGRAKSISQHIFLAHRSPYVPATAGVICGVIRKLIWDSNVSTAGRRNGPHSLRHSLASRLLKDNVPMPVISEVLGHDSTETTMSYLRIDLVSLQKCVLPVPSINDNFYTQKGGAFYEKY